MKGVVVAPRKRGCSLCGGLSPREVADVNAAIWPEGPEHARSRSYRTDGVRVAAANGLTVEAKTITRHADHIEASFHIATPKHPPVAGDIAVMPTDYESVMTKMADVGMRAADRIVDRIDEMDDRDLISVAKLGQTAAAQREALRLRKNEGAQSGLLLQALFGLSGGQLSEGDVPESEVLNVTPPEVMLDEVRQERRALKALQTGEPLVDAASR